MVVLKQLENINELSNYCGEPLRERSVVNNMLLSCDDWAALVIGEKVKEVWKRSALKKTNPLKSM